MSDKSKAFMGRGWAFPVEFHNEGSVRMLSGEEDIQNSLEVLFSTQVGERIMQPDYGSELGSFVFTPLNKSTITYMKAIISDAILFYEPRIILEDILIEPSKDRPGVLEINLSYRVSATNNRYNYVYPFYHQEGTNLER
ncbi:MAG TPA: GPW/gp25 family protein [Puia sp.]|nr:GPW/gp25 family protein [Puia sp.]